MMSSAALLFIATLALTVLTHAQPLSESPSVRAPSTAAHTQRLQKRTITKEPSAEELAVLKDLILSRVASELSETFRERPAAAKRAKEESELVKEQQQQQEAEAEAAEEEAIMAEAKAKRLFTGTSSGLPGGEIQTMKRQIRYHQCYFNPISCFRRK